jgi:methanogenic corrinoid protein MtbC1
VAAEHHLSEQVLTKLLGLLDGGAGGAGGTAVICCGPRERHECGPLSLAVLLQADGWRVPYLGPDTPLADAVALARKLGARALCVGATMPAPAEAVRGELEKARRAHPKLAVVLGGAAFGGPTALEAVEQLRSLAA